VNNSRNPLIVLEIARCSKMKRARSEARRPLARQPQPRRNFSAGRILRRRVEICHRPAQNLDG
jgi:hypothetical protein